MPPGQVDQHVRSRIIDSPVARVFAVLADPTQHPATEPGDWVRDALDVEPLTQVGQVFGMEMFHENAGGRYEIHNTVIALEPDRVIAWRPGQWENGVLGSGGWWWRYELEPVGASAQRTAVTLVYDWSEVPAVVREEFGGMPALPVEFLDESLAALARHVEADRRHTD